MSGIVWFLLGLLAGLRVSRLVRPRCDSYVSSHGQCVHRAGHSGYHLARDGRRVSYYVNEAVIA